MTDVNDHVTDVTDNVSYDGADYVTDSQAVASPKNDEQEGNGGVGLAHHLQGKQNNCKSSRCSRIVEVEYDVFVFSRGHCSRQGRLLRFQQCTQRGRRVERLIKS